MDRFTPLMDMPWHQALLGELRQRAWQPSTPLWGTDEYEDLYYAQRYQLGHRVRLAAAASHSQLPL